MPKKHSVPTFLGESVQPDAYERWLHRKAKAHTKRDRKRAKSSVTVALYEEAIHAAVLRSEGRDAYTGERLDWSLISTYKNDESKIGKHSYKAGFALLPTVDHVSAGATEAAFRICGWRTNDSKNDLSPEAYIELCKLVLAHAGYAVNKI